MRILLVNDDGYRADGINVLSEALIEKGHKVAIIAPDSEQSGKSHSMSILGTCYAKEYSENRFHLSGSPADCVIYGVKSGLLKMDIDLVISGINHGYNLSSDIIYSGTCAAARQATLYGYKAIAISRHIKRGTENPASYFREAADFLIENLDEYVSQLKRDYFLNINIPMDFNGMAKEASIGEIIYNDEFRMTNLEDGRIKIDNIDCRLEFRRIESDGIENDFDVCREGYASLTYVDILPTSMVKRNE